MLNIPNTLSMLRIMTIPVIVQLIIHSNRKNFPILIIIYFGSIWLDFFDGYLARKLSQETELGKLLDPLADKLMVFSLVTALVIKTDFPLWLGIVIIARDIMIVAVSAVVYKGKHTIFSSILVGKAAFALLGFLMLVYIVDLSDSLDLFIMKRFLIPLNLSFMLWSFFEYSKIYIRKKNENKYPEDSHR